MMKNMCFYVKGDSWKVFSLAHLLKLFMIKVCDECLWISKIKFVTLYIFFVYTYAHEEI